MAIIDKTGSVILYERSGGLNHKEFETALVAYRSGERQQPRMGPQPGAVEHEPIYTSLRASSCST
jgi:hypothetical protein